MKKIAQMTKNELIALANEYEVSVDESMSKADIKSALKESDITDDVIEDSKQENRVETGDYESTAETEDEVLVRMLINAASYTYGRYVFTKLDPFAVMDKESAERIVDMNPNEFRKASEKEIREYYS